MLQDVASERLAQPWDHVGLQVGDPAWLVRTAMLCIDLTESVLDEAIEAGATLIVAYHPLIFSPLTALTIDDPKQRVVLRAAQHKIGVYSPHTALDSIEGGVNDWLCNGLGDGQRVPIQPAVLENEVQYKLVTFVPHESADGLRKALALVGAGVIGHYTQCSFGTSGEGTFRGDRSTKPAVGQRGRLERVQELRLEMVCPGTHISQVIDTLVERHPYEEPAYDVYRLEPRVQYHEGQGRVVTLDRPVSLSTLIQRVKKHLRLDSIDVAIPTGLKKIERVGVCAGAGGSLIKEAGSINAFLTGEMRHHDVLEAKWRGIMVMLAGHTQTERPYLKTYRQRIMRAGGKQIKWLISKTDQPPSQLK